MRKLATIIFIAYTIFAYSQQEQMYTQYMFNKMGLNPAYAGNDEYLSITAQLRDQWNGFPGAPEAQVLSVNLPRFNNKIGVGFNLQRRSIGINKAVTFSGIYAYKFLLGQGTLSMGLEASGRNVIADYTDDRLVATQGLENDPSIPNQKISKTYANLGFGIYFNTNNYFLGLSIPRLAKGDIDFDDNDVPSTEVRHLLMMGGIAFPVSKDLSLTTQVLLKFAENSPFDADGTIGLTLDEKYTAALGYRFGGAQGDIGESLALLLSFRLGQRFMLGFSHDFTLSKIRNYDNGSFEVVATYAFSKQKAKVVLLNPRYF